MLDNKFKDLQVGDKVIVRVSGGFNRCVSYYIGIVSKKTPSGLLDVIYGKVTERFKPNGIPYAKQERYSIRYVCLEEYIEERAKEIEANNRRESLIKYLRAVEWEKYSNEELDSIFSHIYKLRSS